MEVSSYVSEFIVNEISHYLNSAQKSDNSNKFYQSVEQVYFNVKLLWIKLADSTLAYYSK